MTNQQTIHGIAIGQQQREDCKDRQAQQCGVSRKEFDSIATSMNAMFNPQDPDFYVLNQ